ncbi:MAG: RDD family protein [Rhizobiaceae bacterium]
MPRRNFLRRAIAYFVDMFSLSILLSLLLAILISGLKLDTPGPQIWVSSTCEPGEMLSKNRIREIFAPNESFEHVQFICSAEPLFGKPYTFVSITVAETKNGSRSFRKIEFAIDENGKLISLNAFNWMLIFAAPLVFAFLLHKRGYTLGKWLMGLRVRAEGNINPKFSTALKREYLKALPFLLITLVLGFQLQPATSDLDEFLKSAASNLSIMSSILQNPWLFFLVWVLMTVPMIWYQLGSFIRWNGRTYWDRWSGLTTFRPKRENEAKR